MPQRSRWPASPPTTPSRVDYAFRAVHMTVTETKKIVAAYYGRAPAYSLLGRLLDRRAAGLISAQRFPGDFDGIVRPARRC